MMDDLAPLTVTAALKRLRARAVTDGDRQLLDLVERATAGSQSARSACIRLWYGSK